jgi:hypothetical protein
MRIVRHIKGRKIVKRLEARMITRQGNTIIVLDTGGVEHHLTGGAVRIDNRPVIRL